MGIPQNIIDAYRRMGVLNKEQTICLLLIFLLH